MKYTFFFMLVFCNLLSYGQAALVGNPMAAGAKVAYVNTDTLEVKYELLAVKQKEFKERQDKIETELQNAFQKIQDDVDVLEKKEAAHKLTDQEYNDGEKQLLGRKQTLETLKQSMTDHLARDKDEFNAELKNNLDHFLEEYNKTKHYDCILSYTWSGSAVLYIDKRLDITNEVVKGLNRQAKAVSRKKK